MFMFSSYYSVARRKYEQRVKAQNMPCSITVNEYELSMFIY
jgi:hypothetical protein